MTQDRKLLPLEATTVLLVAGLALWSVRPLLEEWGTLANFQDAGPLYPWGDMLPSMALRPLHMAGYLLQWVAGGGAPIGVAIAAVIVTIARYAVIRWAVTPVLDPVDRWVVATFGAVLLAWPAAWLGRYIGAQISCLFFFAALGCSLRVARGASWPSLALGVLATLVSLLFYQALALAMLAASVLCAVWAFRAEASARARRNALRAGAVFLLGLSVYAVYAGVMSAFDLGIYEGKMAAEPISLAFVARRIGAVYASAFGTNVLTAPLILALAVGFVLASRGGSSLFGRKWRLARVTLAVLALPLLSLVYLNLTHAADPERTLFPVSVGFILVLIAIGSAGHGEPSRGRSVRPAASFVFVALLVSLGFALQVRTYWDIQSSIIAQISKKKHRSDGGILLKDMTGALGGTYTFYAFHGPDGISRTMLWDALRLDGLRMNVSLCTPLGTDRVRDVHNRAVPRTERCGEEGRFLPYDRVLVARWGANGIVMAPEPSRQVSRGKPVRFDESGAGDSIIGDGWSGQEADYRWSEGSTASLTVELPDGGAAELVLRLDPFLGGGLEAQRVRVAVNGIEAGMWVVDRRGDYAVPIPPQATGDGHLEIVLSISDPTEPCKVLASADCRPLGVAIRKLVVN